MMKYWLSDHKTTSRQRKVILLRKQHILIQSALIIRGISNKSMTIWSYTRIKLSSIRNPVSWDKIEMLSADCCSREPEFVQSVAIPTDFLKMVQNPQMIKRDGVWWNIAKTRSAFLRYKSQVIAHNKFSHKNRWIPRNSY